MGWRGVGGGPAFASAIIGTADLNAFQPFVKQSQRGDGIGEKFKRAVNGYVGQAGRAPGAAAGNRREIACAQGMGNIPRRGDEKNVHVRVAAGKLGANKLVAPPDVIPIFKGNKDQRSPGVVGVERTVCRGPH